MFKLILNAKTRVKIMLGFMIVIVLNFMIVTSSIIALNASTNAAKTIDETLSVAFKRIDNLENAFEQTNNAIIKGLNNLEQGYNPASFKGQIPGLLNNLQQHVGSLNEGFIDIPAYHEANQKLRAAASNYMNTVMNNVVPMLNSNQAMDALAVYARDALPLMHECLVYTGKITVLQTEQCREVSSSAADPSSMYFVITTAVVGLVAAIAIAMVIATYISAQVNAYIHHVERMAEGDFTRKARIGNQDEFGRARLALNKLNDAVNNIINLTKGESNKLRTELESINNSSHIIQHASDDVQSQAMTVAAASDQMVSTTADIARNCERAAQGSNVCRDITLDGMNLVQRSLTNVEQQVENTKDNSNKIEKLAEKSRDISVIVSTIDDIADQTNLLALNASIEAARAGEAGRGFAVVADEVRSLATKTAQSTKEITSMVREIQSFASSASESINNSVEHMAHVATDSKELEHLLSDIRSHVTDVNTQITQIATSAEEQTTATGEISANAQNVTTAASEMTEQSSLQTSSIETTLQDLQKLSDALSFFKTAQPGK